MVPFTKRGDADVQTDTRRADTPRGYCMRTQREGARREAAEEGKPVDPSILDFKPPEV